MPDVTLSHAEQYRLESFLEQVSGQTAADIAHFERIGEAALAEGKRLFQEQIRMMRDLLADKGVMKRPLAAPRVDVGQLGLDALSELIKRDNGAILPPLAINRDPTGTPEVTA